MGKQFELKNIVQPEMLNVSDVFNNVEYVVPIYQRNYAWEKDQIEQMLQDVDDIDASKNDSYYLGSLIVNQSTPNRFDVIDGQQRLTTLYLMMFSLDKMYVEFKSRCPLSIPEGALKFEARKRSNETFNRIKAGGTEKECFSEELINGFNIIQNYFKSKFKNLDCYESFCRKLSKVKVVRVQVPMGIDLNHYFEIMNTRGEQLKPHEIAKARILGKLSEVERNAAAKIWDACALMDSYVQMNFDTASRKKLFGNDWEQFLSNSFEDTVAKCENVKQNSVNENQTTALVEFLKNESSLSDGNQIDKNEDDEEQDRFESIISFPNFLLQVNAAISPEDDDCLDDKRFLKILEHNWDSPESAKKFIFYMLQCRYLLDKYIIKREFYKDYKEDGKWMLQGIKAYHDEMRNSLKPQYYCTYNDKNDNETTQTGTVRALESCLRITYTSPKMMHWISDVMRSLLNDKKTNLVKLLEIYCCQKLKESGYKKRTGFQIERIVFTYLDYLLWRDGYSLDGKILIEKQRNYQYQYRNSIEHFYPQHPAEKKAWDSDDLNSLGNLALITVTGNSKFSNNDPMGKISTYSSIINQSLKLIVMKEMTLNNQNWWTQDLAETHRQDMLNILDDELKRELAPDFNSN